MGWLDGEEIISTSIIFVSTNHVALYENMVIRFADVDEYFCLAPTDVEKKITWRIRAVIYSGYGGRVGKLREIIEICKKHNIKLILDADQMAGTKVEGVVSGTWEGVDVAVYSFHAVNNLPTGDSGMICWADAENDRLTRKYTWLGVGKDTFSRTYKDGYTWKYDVEDLGYEYNGNSIMAAIGLVQLNYLDEDNARRREIVKMYDDCFKDNPKITIIPANFPEECSYHLYELAVPDRDGLLQHLASNGIYCSVHYRDNTEYDMYSYLHGTCPKAHDISQHLITMPLHLGLTNNEIMSIGRLVNEFVR